MDELKTVQDVSIFLCDLDNGRFKKVIHTLVDIRGGCVNCSHFNLSLSFEHGGRCRIAGKCIAATLHPDVIRYFNIKLGWIQEINDSVYSYEPNGSDKCLTCVHEGDCKIKSDFEKQAVVKTLVCASYEPEVRFTYVEQLTEPMVYSTKALVVSDTMLETARVLVRDRRYSDEIRYLMTGVKQ